MIIERSLNTTSPLSTGVGAAVGAAIGAGAAAVLTPGQTGREGSTREFHQGALNHANQMANLQFCAAQVANPLDTIPNNWFPQGQYNRTYGGYLGPVPIPGTSGTANINRTPTSITLNSPHGNFSLAQDPNNPGRVICNSPAGQFNGTLRTGQNGEAIFDDGAGHVVTMQRQSGGLFGGPYIEVNASGFGLPAGHLRVAP